MSRVGKQIIQLPKDVKITQKGLNIEVKGPKGSLSLDTLKNVKVVVEDDKLSVLRNDDTKESLGFHGLTRSLLNNMVIGVTKGFEKVLEINGVGYKAEASGKNIKLSLGFSHPVVVTLPKSVDVKVDGKKTKMTFSSIDKQELGAVCAKIRSFRPPEPYRGKGIKYADEIIIRKEGKAAGKKA